MESIKCSSNQATFVLIFCCHQTPVQSLTFELIAKIEKNDSIFRQMGKIGQSKADCAPAPNGLFHSIAPRPDPRCWGVLFDRVVVLSSSFRRTRTHNLPIGLPLLPQKSSPNGSFWSSIADRTLVSNFTAIFTVALLDVASAANSLNCCSYLRY